MHYSIEEAFRHANRLLEQQQAEAAEPLLQQIIASTPQHHGAWHGLGLVAFHRGQLDLAIQQVIRAIRLDGNIALYHRNLAELFRQAGLHDKAILAARNAVALAPEDAAAHYNLALAQASKGNTTEAIASYRKAIELQPGHVMALNNLGNLYSELGQMEQARHCFTDAIQHQPAFADAHYNLSALKTYTEGDEHYHLLKTLGATPEKLPAASRINLFFALGKAHEDCHHHTEAFTAYAQGNRLYRQLNPYDEAAEIRNHEALRKTFTPEFIANHHGLGHDGTGAIFIVGMPRSGTTLVEQILSSHSQIGGAGEIPLLSDVMDAISGKGELFYPQRLTGEQWAMMGRSYLDGLDRYRDSPDKHWISNKTPNNFLFIGLIHLMLPKARIIHVLRDPMDSCFSCYARLFSAPVPFSYDLQELGRYYVRYRELMDYWESVLPPGCIHTVEYEKLVGDFESQVQALINHIGLPWESQCLEFQNNRRKVNTASIAQVRKPLYSTSVARWEHFRDELQPLMEIVRDYRPAPA